MGHEFHWDITKKEKPQINKKGPEPLKFINVINKF
jgi:hypothetical protein